MSTPLAGHKGDCHRVVHATLTGELNGTCSCAFTYSLADVLQVLRNVGIDVNCGACVETALCGLTQAPHDCPRAPVPVTLEHGLGAVCD